MRESIRRLFALALVGVAIAAAAVAADEPVDLDNPEKAAKKFEKAVEKAPADPDNHYNLGLAYLKLERWPDAEKSLRRAAELNPASALIQSALGAALARTGKIDEAIKAYQAALAIDPLRLDVQANLAQTLLDAGRYDEAIEAYKGALKNKPVDPSNFYNNLGFAYMKKGDTDQALKWFERNVEVAPDSAITYYNLGQIYRRVAGSGDHDPKLWIRAADTFVRAATMDPKNLLGLFFAGEALVMAGRNAEGLEYLERYIAADPGGKKTSPDAYETAVGFRADLKK